MCQFWELSCKIGEVASEATHNIIAEWAYNIIQDVSATLLKVGTVWTGVGTPRLGGADSAVGFVHSTTHILVVALAVASLFVAGIHLALSRRWLWSLVHLSVLDSCWWMRRMRFPRG